MYAIAELGVVPDPQLGKGPIKSAQDAYFGEFKKAGIYPDYADILVWDPAMITIDALRHVGLNASAQQIRDYILQLHSWGGVMGLYDFRDGSQAGVGENSLLIYRWNTAANVPVVASKRAGYVR